MLYKDQCNGKSNQQNLGTIHCSNLCTEIVEYTSPDEVAVCNLASVALPAFVSQERVGYDFQTLYEVVKVVRCLSPGGGASVLSGRPPFLRGCFRKRRAVSSLLIGGSLAVASWSQFLIILVNPDLALVLDSEAGLVEA